VIRADGKYVLPGFIDAHVHLRDYYSELFITHGITSIVDWAGSTGSYAWILAQKEGVAKGKIYGARVYSSGEMIREDADVSEAAQQVRQIAARGFDKIDIGYNVRPEVVAAVIAEAKKVGLPVSGYPVHTRAAIEAGISAVKHTYTVGIAAVKDPARKKLIEQQAGLPDREQDAKLALLGDDYDDLVQLMIAKKTAWVPTFVKDMKVTTERMDEFERDNVRLVSNPELQYLPILNLLPQLTNVYPSGIGVVASGVVGTVDRSSPDFAVYRHAYRNLQDFAKKLVAGGGRVLAGTAPHSFVLPGLSLHHEMQLLVDAGLTPMQALQSASSWPAEYVNKQNEVGVLAPGRFGDVVILTRNPLENIANTRSAETVIQGGRVQPMGYHHGYANPIPRGSAAASAPGEGVARPQLDSVSPDVTTEGGAPTEITLRGRAFVRASTVMFERIPLDTTFVSPVELKAVVPEWLIRAAGAYSVYVSNPRPGGGESVVRSFFVKYR
jgi:imidazolonepropionase-like amidohydrolase